MDGAAAAAFFSRFIEDKFHPGADFQFTGMAHKASQLFEDSLFDGDENAIVDFKYSPNPKLTWWFDHHQSAFLSPEDAEHFRRDASGRKLFNPDFRSCTAFIAAEAKQRWTYEAPDLDELVRWADIVDGAQYKDAEEAVGLSSPATKLTLVIEGVEGSDLVQHIIRLMRRQSLAEIVEDAQVQASFGPLYERHLQSVGIIREHAACEGTVVYFDLIGTGMEGYNKFIPYYLFPESVFTVSVSQSSFRTKVSVGSNPWVDGPWKHNLATICERYGGGGHARVGAISFPRDEEAAAREAVGEIVAELRAAS